MKFVKQILLLSFLFIPFLFYSQQSPSESINKKEFRTSLDSSIVQDMEYFENVNLYVNNANHTRDIGIRRSKWRARWIVLRTYGIGPFFRQAPFSFLNINGYLVVHGNPPMRMRGGNFVVVINRYNGALEVVYHDR